MPSYEKEGRSCSCLTQFWLLNTDVNSTYIWLFHLVSHWSLLSSYSPVINRYSVMNVRHWSFFSQKSVFLRFKVVLLFILRYWTVLPPCYVSVVLDLGQSVSFFSELFFKRICADVWNTSWTRLLHFHVAVVVIVYPLLYFWERGDGMHNLQ